ncbi:hypothetical protein SAMN05216436_1446 [bacterium A37T11]|nr:hypothetical protein SAMN05216436_1446 [bacterium A37T11]
MLFFYRLNGRLIFFQFQSKERMSQTNSIKHQTGISPLSEPYKLVIEEALTIDEDALQGVIYMEVSKQTSLQFPWVIIP